MNQTNNNVDTDTIIINENCNLEIVQQDDGSNDKNNNNDASHLQPSLQLPSSVSNTPNVAVVGNDDGTAPKEKQQQQQKKRTSTTTTTVEIIETLGRKARERLQEQRSKRRVIQRISTIDDCTTGSTTKDDNSCIGTSGRMARQQQQQSKSSSSFSTALIESVTAHRKVVPIPKKSPTPPTQTTTKQQQQQQQQAKKTTTSTTTKRQRRSRNKDDISVSRRLMDQWVPDVSHIDNDCVIGETTMTTTTTINDTTATTTIQLHGLPIHTTAQHIRVFLTGLPIQNIFVLLPYPSSYHFQLIDYDAKYENMYRSNTTTTTTTCATTITTRKKQQQQPSSGNVYNKGNDFRIERYGSNVRVFVQFSTVSLARLAQQRSGEIMYTERYNCYNNNNNAAERDEQDPSQIGAAIAITIVPSIIARFCIQLLAIDVTNNNQLVDTTKQGNGRTIQQILDPITQILDPIITITLWDAVIDELSLRVDIQSIDDTNVKMSLPKVQSCLLHIADSNISIQTLQHDKKQVQLEMERIVTKASSVIHNNEGTTESKNGNNYDWNRILLFLLSTNTTSTNATTTTTTMMNDSKFQCLLDTMTNIHYPPNHCNDPIIQLTYQYIQLLQTYIHRLDTTIQAYRTNRQLYKQIKS